MSKIDSGEKLSKSDKKTLKSLGIDINKDLSMNTIKFYHKQKEYIVQSQNINQHTFNKNYNKVLALLNSNEIKSINECELIPSGKTDILKLSPPRCVEESILIQTNLLLIFQSR